MHQLMKKEQILTWPNLLSLFRLLLIPLFSWLYCSEGRYAEALFVIIVSALSDVADGFIARKYNMVSDLGKILDPVADKLTQAALLFCLSCHYRWVLPLLIVFSLRELCMLLMAYITILKYASVNSAKWYGKLNTAVMYGVSMLLILFPGMPGTLANALLIFCGLILCITFFLYLIFYINLWKRSGQG
ncbi:MAG: CDP-alcohol phosphatidyltransferase family protein [Bacillota bacterium]|nr:CDP-alcohol phosphatidyltransferase family protein [Bacillota bacterium]